MYKERDVGRGGDGISRELARDRVGLVEGGWWMVVGGWWWLVVSGLEKAMSGGGGGKQRLGGKGR